MFLSQAVGSFMGFLAPFLIIHTWLKIHMCQLLSAACVRHWVRFVVLSVAKGNTEEIITAAPHIFNQFKKKSAPPLVFSHSKPITANLKIQNKILYMDSNSC